MELNNLNNLSGSNSNPENDSKNPDKRPYFTIVLVFILVAISLVYWLLHTFKSENKVIEDTPYDFWNNSSSTQVVDDVVTSTIDSVTTTTGTAIKKTTVIKKASTVKTSSTSLSATSDYLKARNSYQTSGYYFQFLNCHGSPGSLVVKKGAKIMLDNRDNKTRKIVFMSRLYNIGAYSYTIVTADKLGKSYITCDGGGAAQIEVKP
ncbi:MAG TPA: hypothetical protein P5230_03120 [Candidatus Magasanikbacteria bacterium]|nr:hypothetical protein [Candidatus Magasanikbacteria bacterium]